MLASLAGVGDLATRKIKFDNPDAAMVFLNSASAAVRDAAGVPISRGEWTFDLLGHRERNLLVPVQPIVEVDTVLIDDEPVTDYRLIAGEMWREAGWRASSWSPSKVTITATAGYDPVPEDVVDLVCAMTAQALNLAADEGYQSRGDLVSTRIDDYSEQYASNVATRTAGPMELPPLTRTRLRARFGVTAVVVRAR